jgi:hypothetical protein
MLVEILLASRQRIVGESRVWTYEDIVLDSETVPQLNPGLDCDPISKNYIVLDEGVVANVAVNSNLSSFKDVGEGPYARAVPNVCRFEKGTLVYEEATLTHQILPMLSRPERGTLVESGRYTRDGP